MTSKFEGGTPAALAAAIAAAAFATAVEFNVFMGVTGEGIVVMLLVGDTAVVETVVKDKGEVVVAGDGDCLTAVETAGGLNTAATPPA